MAAAAPGLLAETHTLVQPALVAKTAYVDTSASSAITHQSNVNLVRKVPVVHTYAAAPVVHAAPVVSTYAAAPVVHSVPVVHSAPLVKTVVAAAPVVHSLPVVHAAPLVKTVVAAAPVVHAAPLVKTVVSAPVAYTAYHK